MAHPEHQPPRPDLSDRWNRLRVAAAHWLMPANPNGYDGSVELTRRPTQESTPARVEPESKDGWLVGVLDDEAEVIWLTRLLAIVATGVLAMMIRLFTPLAW